MEVDREFERDLNFSERPILWWNLFHLHSEKKKTMIGSDH